MRTLLANLKAVDIRSKFTFLLSDKLSVITRQLLGASGGMVVCKFR